MSSLRKDDAVRYPARTKGLLGIIAFLLGYLLTYLWARGRLHSVFTAVTVRERGETITFARYLANHGISVSTWKGAGWLFYNAHFVSLSGSRTLDLIAEGGGNLRLLSLVPPVVLTVAGAVAANGSYGRTIWHTGYSGALIFLGYFPVAVVGSLLFAVSISVPVGPELLFSAVVCGVTYPVVFGAIGGGLMHEIHKRSVRRNARVAS